MQHPPNNDIKREWEHAHICPKCGHAMHPDEISLGSIVLGDITCSNCEWSGPINVKIVEKSRPGHND